MQKRTNQPRGCPTKHYNNANASRFGTKKDTARRWSHHAMKTMKNRREEVKIKMEFVSGPCQYKDPEDPTERHEHRVEIWNGMEHRDGDETINGA